MDRDNASDGLTCTKYWQKHNTKLAINRIW